MRLIMPAPADSTPWLDSRDVLLKALLKGAPGTENHYAHPRNRPCAAPI